MAGAVQQAAHDGSLDYEMALLDCAKGQIGGVAKVYEAERGRLEAVTRRIVRDRERAEDVIQDAFVQIVRDATSFDPKRGSARSWIYTIVRNTAFKSIRDGVREVSVTSDELESIREASRTFESPSRLAEEMDVRSCLEQVEPRRRATLILAIIDGRTHTEIGELLGVPVGTVKAWIRRELIALRERLR